MPMRDIRQIKMRIRERCRAVRTGMPPGRKSAHDKKMLDVLCGLKQYKQCKIVFAYVSKDIEVDTHALIGRALKDGKRVAVPRCVPGTRDMEFYWIGGLSELKSGAFGVLEPVPGRHELVEEYTEALCVVPGLCFDSTGFRLGYGKGYYDRFMSTFEGFSVGLCYSECVQWKLPHGQYDRSVDLLITERYIRYTSRCGERVSAASPGAQQSGISHSE